MISIHALVKRATNYNYDFYGCLLDFNPRPREEGDLIIGHGGADLDISIHALVKRATKSIQI